MWKNDSFFLQPKFCGTQLKWVIRKVKNRTNELQYNMEEEKKKLKGLLYHFCILNSKRIFRAGNIVFPANFPIKGYEILAEVHPGICHLLLAEHYVSASNINSLIKKFREYSFQNDKAKLTFIAVPLCLQFIRLFAL